MAPGPAPPAPTLVHTFQPETGAGSDGTETGAGDHVPELSEDLVLPLDSLLLAEHGQGALLVSRVDLVLLPEPETSSVNSLWRAGLWCRVYKS